MIGQIPNKNIYNEDDEDDEKKKYKLCKKKQTNK